MFDESLFSVDPTMILGESVRQLRPSSLDCRPAWKSFLTLANCNLLNITFFLSFIRA